MGTTPFLIVLDDETQQLGPVALDLIRLGFNPLYTRWLDEALMLAEQEAGVVRMLVSSLDVRDGEIAILRSQVAQALDGETPALLVVGGRPDDHARARLRHLDADSALWTPYRAEELRFLVHACLAKGAALLARREPRAPLGCLAWLCVRGSRSFASLYSLSARGAFVEMPEPLPVGTLVEFEFGLEDGAAGAPENVALSARVAYQHTRQQAQSTSQPVGNGLVFEKIAPELEDRIRAFVSTRADRYRP